MIASHERAPWLLFIYSWPHQAGKGGMLPFVFRPLEDPGDFSLASICPLLMLFGSLFTSCFIDSECVRINIQISQSCGLLFSRITDGNFMI